MAKDSRDTETVDFVGVPRKRGRKATGNAKTAAERQAAYRERKAAQAKPLEILQGEVTELRNYENELIKQFAGERDRYRDWFEKELARSKSLQKQNEMLLKKLQMAKR